MRRWLVQTLNKVVATCSAVAALLLPWCATARPVADSPLTLTYVDSLRVGAQFASTSSRTAETPLRFTASSSDSANTWASVGLANARLVEMPRQERTGTYSRPHYALGFRSETMRVWMNHLGIEATSCLAPVVRLRSKLSSEGALSGTLWLYARCDIR